MIIWERLAIFEQGLVQLKEALKDIIVILEKKGISVPQISALQRLEKKPPISSYDLLLGKAHKALEVYFLIGNIAAALMGKGFFENINDIVYVIHTISIVSCLFLFLKTWRYIVVLKSELVKLMEGKRPKYVCNYEKGTSTYSLH